MKLRITGHIIHDNGTSRLEKKNYIVYSKELKKHRMQVNKYRFNNEKPNHKQGVYFIHETI